MTLSKYKNEIAGLLGVIGIFSLIFFLDTAKVFGNPSYFAPNATNTTSTTTPTFMTPTTATTTVVYDSFNIKSTNGAGANKSFATDEATLLIQFTATSTSSILNWRYEYSQDGQDWYADNLYIAPSASSTPILVQTPTLYSWQFASSTSKCDTTQIDSTNNRGCKAIIVKTPTRYVRVILYIAPGAANGEVYAQFVPKQQTQQ